MHAPLPSTDVRAHATSVARLAALVTALALAACPADSTASKVDATNATDADAVTSTDTTPGADTATTPDTIADAAPDIAADAAPDTAEDVTVAPTDADPGEVVDDATPPTEASGQVGAEGGTIGDETLGLAVPANAVDGDVTLSVAATTTPPPEDLHAVGPVYAFEPDGTVFAHPITVTLPLPPGATGPLSVFWSNDHGGFDDIGGTVVGDTIQVQVVHFSEGTIAPAAATRTVVGSRVVTHATPSAITNVPLDLRALDVGAVFADGHGGWTTVAGTGAADGTFAIDGVPRGPYFLRLGSSYYRTEDAVIDAGWAEVGRPGTVDSTQTTTLELDVSNLEPWQDGDFLELVAPDCNAFWWNLEGYGNGPEVGDDHLAAFPVLAEWADTSGAHPAGTLVDGGAGDRVALDQLSVRDTFDGLSYRALSRVFVPEPFTQIDGGTLALSGAFVDVSADMGFSIDLRTTEFAAMIGPGGQALNPAAQTVGPWTFSVLAMAGGLGVGEFGPTAALVSLDPLDAQGDAVDVLAEGMTYGMPLGGAWDTIVDLRSTQRVRFWLGSGPAARFFLTARQSVDARRLGDGVFRPLVGPVRSPTIDGLDLFSEQTAFGRQPTLAWQPPSVGSATSYGVEVYHLYLAEDGAKTLQERIASFVTTETTLEVLPGILTLGERYAFVIAANHSEAAVSAPERSSPVDATVPVLSAIQQPLVDSGGCVVGSDCAPGPCRTGLTTCPDGVSGLPHCEPTGVYAAGDVCGPNRVCDAAQVCSACIDGEPCDAPDACHEAAITCDTGHPVCAAAAVPDGTGCGVDLYCRDGVCGPCSDGAACTPAAPSACQVGAVDCASGAPVCLATAVAVEDGTGCGTDHACHAGVCEACKAGVACTPSADPCKVGAIGCATGLPVCAATAVAVDDGTGCGTDRVCHAGTCGACASGAACTPAAPNACKVGAVSCATGLPVCVAGSQSLDDGTPCGEGFACSAGACVGKPVLALVSGGGQSALPGQAFAAAIKVKLTSGGSPMSGATVSFVVPAGVAVSPAQATTNASGEASATLVAGRVPGALVVTAKAASAGDLTIDELVSTPTDGTMLPILNAARVLDVVPALPAPAITAKFGYAGALAAAPDGTLYVADLMSPAVYRISVEGVLTRVLGTGEAGNDLDARPALSTRIGVTRSLALDAAHGVLYALDTANRVVRAVDLAAGSCSLFAGGGSVGAPEYGDGGPATQANLVGPTAIALAPDGAVVVVDPAAERFRSVPRGGGTITTWTNPIDGGVGAVRSDANAAWDAAGQAFVVARWNAPVMGASSNLSAIARLAASGPATRVLGGPAVGGAIGDFGPTYASANPYGPMVFGANGSLYVFERYHLLGVDSGTMRTSLVAGPADANASGATGDFGPATDALLNGPQALASDAAGNLYVAENYSGEVRAIWRAGGGAATSVTLSKVGGDAQAARPLEPLSNPLKAALVAGGAPVTAGFEVRWSVPAGSGAGVVAGVSTTDAAGQASVGAWTGLAVGTYDLLASVRDLHGVDVTGSPVTFHASTIAPASGTGFPVLNPSFAFGFAGIPGSARTAQINSPLDFHFASDGSLYLLTWAGSAGGDIHLLRVTPAGYVSDETPNGFGIAGSLVRYFALDEERDRILVPSSNLTRIVAYSLTDHTTTPIAGNGTVGYVGNGGAATDASIGYNGNGDIVVTSNGTLYFMDWDPILGHTIRRVTSGGTIGAALVDRQCTAQNNTVLTIEDRVLASDANDDLYFIAKRYPCGAMVWERFLFRWTPGQEPVAVVRVQSAFYGTTNSDAEQAAALADGVAALQSRSDTVVAVAVAVNGDIYLTSTATLPASTLVNHRVRKLSGGYVTTIAGLPTATDDYVATAGYAAATSQALGSFQQGLALDGDGHVWFGQYAAAHIRMVW